VCSLSLSLSLSQINKILKKQAHPIIKGYFCSLGEQVKVRNKWNWGGGEDQSREKMEDRKFGGNRFLSPRPTTESWPGQIIAAPQLTSAFIPTDCCAIPISQVL